MIAYKESTYQNKTILGGANNSYYDSSYKYRYDYGYYDEWNYWGDKKYNYYPEYAVIQNGFNKTFGNIGQRNTINEQDLFFTGDSFTFEQVQKFLIKKGSIITSSAIDQTFPYKVTFDEVTHDSFTVTVTKI